MFFPWILSSLLLKTEGVFAENIPQISEEKTQFFLFSLTVFESRTYLLESLEPTTALFQFVNLVPRISASLGK